MSTQAATQTVQSSAPFQFSGGDVSHKCRQLLHARVNGILLALRYDGFMWTASRGEFGVTTAERITAEGALAGVLSGLSHADDSARDNG